MNYSNLTTIQELLPEPRFIFCGTAATQLKITLNIQKEINHQLWSSKKARSITRIFEKFIRDEKSLMSIMSIINLLVTINATPYNYLSQVSVIKFFPISLSFLFPGGAIILEYYRGVGFFEVKRF